MKTCLPVAAAMAAATAILSGCVVAPVPPRAAYVAPVPVAPPAVYVAPAGVAYLAPTYAMPGPGYVWQYHPRYGWGWRHPVHGWHRGWY
jgi:hypothetical protein